MNDIFGNFHVTTPGKAYMTITADGRLVPGEGLSEDEATKRMFGMLQSRFISAFAASRLAGLREAASLMEKRAAGYRERADATTDPYQANEQIFAAEACEHAAFAILALTEEKQD